MPCQRTHEKLQPCKNSYNLWGKERLIMKTILCVAIVQEQGVKVCLEQLIFLVSMMSLNLCKYSGLTEVYKNLQVAASVKEACRAKANKRPIIRHEPIKLFVQSVAL